MPQKDDEGISILDRVLHKLMEAERKIRQRKNTTMLIIDSKSTQNADTVQTKGYDAAEKSGIKLHHSFQMVTLDFIHLLFNRY